MSKFTTLSAGGINYYQESEPSSGKDGEIWLPVTQQTVEDQTTATGTSQSTLYSITDNVYDLAVQNGTIYFNEDGVIFSIEKDGTFNWEDAGYVNTGKDVEVNDNYLVLIQSSEINLVDKSDGTAIWSDTNVGTDVECGELYNDRLFVGKTTNEVEEWKLGDSSLTTTSPLQSHTLHSDEVPSISHNGGRVFSASVDATVKMVYSDDFSTEQWSSSFSNGMISVHADDDAVYAGGYDGIVYALDDTDGSELWSHSHLDSNENVASLITAGGVVYAGGREGNIVAADKSTGDLIWKANVHGAGNNVYGLQTEFGEIYSGGIDQNVINTSLDGVTYVPVNGETGTPQLRYNGEWVSQA